MVTGNGNSSHILQALCSAELYPYPDCYASLPPFIALLAKERTSCPLERIFSQAINIQVSDHFDKSLQNYADCVKLEALFNAQNRIWTPFICLMALESDLGLPIHSIYPVTGSRHAVTLENALFHPREMKCVNLIWSVCANSEGDYYNNRANCDTSMKLGRDGQFDTLKKIGCGHKLKNAPLCYF